MLADSIWKSANIEGLGTSYPNTECILNGIPTSTTWEESTFIINMNRAWKFVKMISYSLEACMISAVRC